MKYKFLVIFAVQYKNFFHMRRLTNKEEAIMQIFWDHGALFVRELRDLYPDPKPHFNTLSTQIRTLEFDGFLAHYAYGPAFQYYPAVSREEYGRTFLSIFVDKCFGSSYLNAVSALVKAEKISKEELRELIEQIEREQ